MVRPILYSFRRCPYCIRARMAIAKAGILCEMREIDLKDKPQSMLDISPKGTVPVVFLPDGTVLEQSLDIMKWALGENDPDGWLNHPEAEVDELIKECDQNFTRAINEYKYPNRFENADPERARATGVEFLKGLERRIAEHGFLFSETPSVADIAIFPFVRQFANVDMDWFENCELNRIKIWLNYFIHNPLFEVAMEKYVVWQTGDPVDVFPIYHASSAKKHS